MQVPAQVAKQPARLALLPRAVAVAHARRALDALVGAHVVDERHEAVVEDGEVQAEDLFGGRRRGASGGKHDSGSKSVGTAWQLTRSTPRASFDALTEPLSAEFECYDAPSECVRLPMVARVPVDAAFSPWPSRRIDDLDGELSRRPRPPPTASFPVASRGRAGFPSSTRPSRDCRYPARRRASPRRTRAASRRVPGRADRARDGFASRPRLDRDARASGATREWHHLLRGREGSTFLWRAPTWTAPLVPMTQLPFEVSSIVVGFDRLYATSLRTRAVVGVDAVSGQMIGEGPIPAAPAYGGIAFSDAWLGAVEVDVRGALVTFDAGASFHPVGVPMATPGCLGPGRPRRAQHPSRYVHAGAHGRALSHRRRPSGRGAGRRLRSQRRRRRDRRRGQATRTAKAPRRGLVSSVFGRSKRRRCAAFPTVRPRHWSYLTATSPASTCETAESCSCPRTPFPRRRGVRAFDSVRARASCAASIGVSRRCTVSWPRSRSGRCSTCPLRARSLPSNTGAVVDFRRV